MNEDRAARVWSSTSARARQTGEPVSLRHVCLACADGVAADGVTVSLVAHVGGLRESVISTDVRSAELTELQATLGEGPSVDVLGGDGPVLISDLASHAGVSRWPIFAQTAAQRGVKAMFSLPIRAGAARLGVLDLYRDRTGGLVDGQLADALGYADAALELMLDLLGGTSRPDDRRAVELFAAPRAVVHQAAGMVSVQLGISLGDALARLRAHAYSGDRSLSDVASDVLARRLRFTGDGDLPRGPQTRDNGDGPSEEPGSAGEEMES